MMDKSFAGKSCDRTVSSATDRPPFSSAKFEGCCKFNLALYAAPHGAKSAEVETPSDSKALSSTRLAQTDVVVFANFAVRGPPQITRIHTAAICSRAAPLMYTRDKERDEAFRQDPWRNPVRAKPVRNSRVPAQLPLGNAAVGEDWDSLQEIQKPEKRGNHFMGFLVFVPGLAQPGQNTTFHLIDGQQRLMTSSILLTAIRNVARRRTNPNSPTRFRTTTSFTREKRAISTTGYCRRNATTIATLRS